MFDLTLITTSVRVIKTALLLSVLFSSSLLGQPGRPEETANPAVGKFRSCRPLADCASLHASPPARDERTCGYKIGLPFGQSISVADPACEAMKAAQKAAYSNDLASLQLAKTECEASNKQAALCAALRNQEIERCITDQPEFVRVAEGVRSGWWLSHIPGEIQVSLAGQFNPAQMRVIIVTDRPKALAPKQFMLDALQYQGWITTGNVLIFRTRISDWSDRCVWVRVLASSEIAKNLGADGYCQVLQFQPEFLKNATAKKAEGVFSALHLDCH